MMKAFALVLSTVCGHVAADEACLAPDQFGGLDWLQALDGEFQEEPEALKLYQLRAHRSREGDSSETLALDSVAANASQAGGPCKCMDVWKSADCSGTYYGCPPRSCSGSGQSWCLVSTPYCSGDQSTLLDPIPWAFCTPPVVCSSRSDRMVDGEAIEVAFWRLSNAIWSKDYFHLGRNWKMDPAEDLLTLPSTLGGLKCDNKFMFGNEHPKECSDYAALYHNPGTRLCTIAFSGTSNDNDWLADIDFVDTETLCGHDWVHGTGARLKAFMQHPKYPSLRAKVLGSTCSGGLYVTGTSLGGALAGIFGQCMKTMGFPILGVYTYGAPKVIKQTSMACLPGKRFYRTIGDRFDPFPVMPKFPGIYHPYMKAVDLSNHPTCENSCTKGRHAGDEWYNTPVHALRDAKLHENYGLALEALYGKSPFSASCSWMFQTLGK